MTITAIKKMLVTLALITSLLACVGFANPKREVGRFYPRAFVVSELDYERDMVIVTDAVGLEWEFEEIEDWEIGDMVVAIMNDNATEIITDDYFYEIEWSGYNFPHNQLDDMQRK